VSSSIVFVHLEIPFKKMKIASCRYGSSGCHSIWCTLNSACIL